MNDRLKIRETAEGRREPMTTKEKILDTLDAIGFYTIWYLGRFMDWTLDKKHPWRETLVTILIDVPILLLIYWLMDKAGIHLHP